MSIESSNSPYISIVVICFNEEVYLERCLLALKNQDYPRDRYEIIIVDNGSKDRSLQISRKYGDVVEVHQNIRVGELRNIGAKIAKGSIVAFLDGDCEASKDWLAKISELSSAYPNTINGSECIIDPEVPWVPIAWFCLNLAGRHQVSALGATNFFMSREIFINEGGFRPGLTTGEDAELFLRLSQKFKIFSDSSLQVIHHGVPLNLKSFFRREMWHGLGALGSFQVNKFDKPLIATIVFLLGILLCLIGLGQYFVYGSAEALILGVGVVSLVLASTLIYRRSYIRSSLHLFQLLVLYFAYFSARSISLLVLLLRFEHTYYRRDRS